uniref:HSP27.8 n=1 Tax=Citrullus lanatus TaxID=3654 RepID=H6TB35_CITLA|nr:HSP27.8 [Citrullus lanatus]
MEHHAGKRRLDVLTAHLAPAGDISPANGHVLPANCCSYESSVIRRCDNKTYFARQGSEACGAYMRQASTTEGNQRSNSQAFRDVSEGPLYSRPAKEGKIPSVGIEQPVAQNFNLIASEPPLFARACLGINEQNNHFISETKQPSSGSNGIGGLSPRMDVAESGRGYVLTVEIPGVKINDIRVEVDDQKLTIIGKRSNQYCEVVGYSSDSISSYHKREILQGPYQVVWPLPININKDGVFAEFWDGLLRITLPKL